MSHFRQNWKNRFDNQAIYSVCKVRGNFNAIDDISIPTLGRQMREREEFQSYILYPEDLYEQ